MTLRIHLFIVSLFSLATLWGQDFGLEMWRDHLPYSKVIKVAKLGTKCYAASPYSMYSVDESDLSSERINTISGLNDFSIGTIGVNESYNTVLVGYENGNLDLIVDGDITNINAILKSNIIGDKKIYNIHSSGKLSYLACGFGIVVLDASKQEIKDTYIFGAGGSQIVTYDVTIFGNDLIAATENGIYKADLNTPFLSDFNAWSKITSYENSSAACNAVHSQNNVLYLINPYDGFSNDTLKVLNASYTTIGSKGDDDFHSLETMHDTTVLITRNYKAEEINNSLQEISSIYTYGFETPVNSNHAIWDGSYWWIGDNQIGLNRCPDNFTYDNFLLQGPSRSDCFHMDAKGDHLYVSTGMISGSAWNNNYNASGILAFDGYDWRTFNRDTDANFPMDSSFDFISSAIDPKDENHAVFCSFYGGLIEYRDNAFVKRYTYYNSALSVSLIHPGNQVKVGTAVIDDEGNIWAANSFVTNPLILITPSGDSYSFSLGTSGSNAIITDMLISSTTNHIWMAIKGKGVIVYDFNNTPEDATDDRYELFTTTEGSGGLPSDEVNCLTEDLDGEIWVGTEKGPAVFFSPASAFESNASDAQQILLLQDGSYQYLLETQSISEIVVDGANRKWLGTVAGGIFLMSPDGTEQIYAFSTENSPIYSNTILSLAMNQTTGELFIGTDLGIVGFRSTAIKASESYNDVYCFPNPVRPGYYGPIAIKGLLEDSDIKVTDASGNLVYSTTSLGGQAVWDGKDVYGMDVVSGVYFIHAVSTDGRSKKATKVLIIR